MILEKLRKWLFGKPDQSLPLAGAHPVAEPPDPESPNPIRFKVVCNGDRPWRIKVTDAETGREICATAVDFHLDFREHRRPELTIKSYLQDFEYEGPGQHFVYCPKCKAEVKSERKDKP